MRATRVRFYALLALIFLSSLFASAQTTTTGGVAGVITDPSGAVVPGVTVTLTSNAKGTTATAKSNSTGSYRFDLVEPGPYSVAVEHPGFEKLQTRVFVSASQVVDVSLKLVVGGSQQTIEVTAGSELLYAENGNVVSTVTHAQVEEVPNSGNDLRAEITMTPGSKTGFGIVGSTTYLIDGQNFNDPYNGANNSGATNLTLGLNDVDEAAVIANAYGGEYGGFIGTTASYTTKGGSNRLHGNATWFWTGSPVNSNTWLNKHNDTKKGYVNVNQWAASIGGPARIPHVLGKDRLFFFADSEGVRADAASASSYIYLPSQTLQSYTITQLTNSGHTASLPYYQKAFALYNSAAARYHAQPGNPVLTANTTTAGSLADPTTGCTESGNNLSSADYAALEAYGGDACTDYFINSAPSAVNESLMIFRVDANITSKDKLFGRMERDYGVQPTSVDPISPAFNAVSIQPEYNGQLNYTRVFTPNIVNNAIFGILWYSAYFGPPSIPAVTSVYPAGLNPGGGIEAIDGSIGSYPTGRNVTTVQLQDDLAITHGRHTFKVGFKGFGTKWNDFYFAAGYVPVETAKSLGAFIYGGVDPNPAVTATVNGKTTAIFTPQNTTFSQNFPVKPNWNVRVDQTAFYGEDDWKATKDLNLSFALRLEHSGNEYCPDGCLTQLNTDWPNVSHDASTPYNQVYNFNQKSIFRSLQGLQWAPRFGFAYNPLSSFVVRGGFGLFYDSLTQSIINGIKFNPPADPSYSVAGDNISPDEASNLWNDTTAYNAAFSGGITNGGTVASIKASLPASPTSIRANFTPPNLFTAQDNFKIYYTEKWNLDVQKTFGPRTSVDINYLGSHGVHRPYTNAGLNAYSPAGNMAGLPTAQPDPRFNHVYRYESEGSTNYNGAIVTFTRKFRRGSIFTAGYNYGKTMSTIAGGFAISDSGSGQPPNPYAPTSFYAPDATDYRHTLALNYVYRVPFKNPFYGGWQVSGAAYVYSGAPFSATDTTLSTTLSGYAAGALPSVAPYAVYVAGSGKEKKCNYYGLSCLSTSQFTNNTNIAYNKMINAWRGPSYVSTDLGLKKDIPLHWEGGVFSISAQAFNVLNHTNFAAPTASLASTSTFGKITAESKPTGVLSSLGGDNSPRILQFQTKITF